MNEKIYLLKNLETFINSDCKDLINKTFKSYYFEGDINTNYLPVIYDNNTYIYCLMNITKEKQQYLIDKNELEITIMNSSYDLYFYKKNESISFIPILIINDINVNLSNENYLEFNTNKIINISNEFIIINLIKDYLKKIIQNKFIECNKHDLSLDYYFNLNNNNNKNNLYNFLNQKNFVFNNDNIKLDIDKLSKINSKILIHCNIIQSNNDINNLFIDVLDIYDPLYKSQLLQKYMNEMPKSLIQLMEKYQNINFIRENYLNYQTNKGIKINLGIKKNDEKNDMEVEEDEDKMEVNNKNDNSEKNEDKITKSKNIFNVKKVKEENKKKSIFSVTKKNKP